MEWCCGTRSFILLMFIRINHLVVGWLIPVVCWQVRVLPHEVGVVALLIHM